MIYTEFDIKLIRHALDTNSEGEAANAAAMFFKELRERGVKAHEFMETKGETPAVDRPRPRHAAPTTQPFPWGYEEEPPKTDYKWMYEFEMRQCQQERSWRVQYQEDLKECQKELALARKKKGWFK